MSRRLVSDFLIGAFSLLILGHRSLDQTRKDIFILSGIQLFIKFMSIITLIRSTSKTKILTHFILICTLCVVITIGMVTAEKTPSTLTIKSFPDNPTLNHGFHVIGQLSTVPGEKLGNKRVTLESSPVGAKGPGNFSPIIIDETGREGEYDFFRPKYSPQEYLRVTFAGNEQYEPAVSTVLPARGAGIIPPEKSLGNGSLSVRTDPQGADIYIDSVFNGTTPRVLNLPEGAHLLEVGLAGYQNETMEAYVSPTRESSFSITLNPKGLGLASTGLSSSLSYAESKSVSFGEPAFSLDSSALSMRLYTNASRYGNSTGKKAQVTTVVSNDTAVNDGYNVMVIMTDH